MVVGQFGRNVSRSYLAPGFYNQPSSNADYDHWCKATYWTLDEAIALSFGKDPEQVSWDKLKNHHSYPPSPFVEQYRKIRDLAIRAKNFNQLYDPILPSLFLAWAIRTGIEVAPELTDGIEAQGCVAPYPVDGNQRWPRKSEHSDKWKTC